MGTYEAIVAFDYIVNRNGSNHDKVYQNFVMCHPFSTVLDTLLKSYCAFLLSFTWIYNQDLAQLQILSFTFY